MKHPGRDILNTLLIVAGSLSARMGLQGFLLSSNFIDGGVTGVSMLGSKMTGTPLSVWIPLINLPSSALVTSHPLSSVDGGMAKRSVLN